MKYLYILMLILALFFFNSLNISGDRQNITADMKVKNASDIGTHDASLQIDEIQREMGSIIFDQVRVQLAFKEALKRNLYLDDILSPLGGRKNIFKSSVQVLYLEGVDYGTFPRMFSVPVPGVPPVMMYRPSVVAVVQYELPKKKLTGTNGIVKVMSIHEYKV